MAASEILGGNARAVKLPKQELGFFRESDFLPNLFVAAGFSLRISAA